MSSVKKIYQFLFYALVFLIPFEDDLRAVPNILLIALSVLLPIVESKIIFKLRQNKIYLFSFVFIIIICLTSFVSHSFSDDIFIIKKLLIIFPILILSIPVKNKKNILLAFVVSIVIGNIISLVGIGHYVIESGNFKIATGDDINNILFVERLYSGILNCLCIAFSFKIWSLNKSLKKYMIANIILSLFMIFLVVSRMAMLLSLLICFIKIINHTSKQRTIAILVISLVSLTIFLALNQNFYKRFLYNDNEVSLYEKIKAWEPRFVIWNCAFNIVQNPNKLVFGNGFYNTQESLNNCYNQKIVKKKRLKYFLDRRFNTHNQYLDLILSKGLIGISLFLTLLFLLFKKCKTDPDLLSILIVLIFFALIENILHRQIGVYLVGLVIIVLAMNNREIDIIDEQN